MDLRPVVAGTSSTEFVDFSRCSSKGRAQIAEAIPQHLVSSTRRCSEVQVYGIVSVRNSSSFHNSVPDIVAVLVLNESNLRVENPLGIRPDSPVYKLRKGAWLQGKLLHRNHSSHGVSNLQ